MKRPRLASLRLEAENVLAMHLFAHQLNGLLQSVLLQETEVRPPVVVVKRLERSGWRNRTNSPIA